MIEESTLPLLDPDEWINAVENTDQGEPLPTPFSSGIPAIQPFVKGRMVVIGALTGLGKTAIGLQTWKMVVDGGHTAAYLTTEMTPADIFERFHYQFDSPEACKAWIRDNNAVISQPGVTAEEVVAVMKAGYDFVVLDHVHDLPFEGHEDLARKVKRIAMHAPYTNTGLLMLAQTKQPDPLVKAPPTRYDFSQTKAIAEAASAAYILWQPDEHDHTLELHCVKNRFGPPNQPIPLRMNHRFVTFERV